MWLDYSKMTVFVLIEDVFNLASKDVVAQIGDIVSLVYIVSSESPDKSTTLCLTTADLIF